MDSNLEEMTGDVDQFNARHGDTITRRCGCCKAAQEEEGGCLI